MHSERERDMRSFVATSADLMVMFVFITLGANLPFDDFADEALPALATVAALILVARPLTVLAFAPDRRGRWQREEIAFVAWTRETASSRPPSRASSSPRASPTRRSSSPSCPWPSWSRCSSSRRRRPGWLAAWASTTTRASP